MSDSTCTEPAERQLPSRSASRAYGRIDHGEPPPPAERERLSRTSATLRFIGSALLVTSASTFLLQHWQEGSSVLRYACLLGHTLLLAVGGYVCGLHVQESRGARSFFALVLASVPVHFAALGGMLHSALPLDGSRGPTDLWPLHSVPTALALIVAGGGVMAALSRLAATLLVRPIAGRYSVAYLALNAFLLIPVRQPVLIAALAPLMLAAFFVFDRRIAEQANIARARPGRFARALLLAPIAIVMLRSLLWYAPTLPVIGAFCLGIGLTLFFRAPSTWPEYTGVQPLAACTAALGCVWMCEPLAASPWLADGLSAPMRTLPALALVGALSLFAADGRAAYVRVALLGSSVIIFVNTCVHFEVARATAPAWLALVTGIAALGLGVYAAQRASVLAGAMCAALGLLQIITSVVHLGALRHWTTLSALGMTLILGAAWLERNARTLARYTGLLRRRLQDW